MSHMTPSHADRLQAAVDQVRELHSPRDLGEMYAITPLRGTLVCEECELLFYEGGGEGERASLWPCPTIRALDERQPEDVSERP